MLVPRGSVSSSGDGPLCGLLIAPHMCVECVPNLVPGGSVSDVKRFSLILRTLHRSHLLDSFPLVFLCLVLGPSCYMYMSAICCDMLYVRDMLYVCYMSSGRGGS